MLIVPQRPKVLAVETRLAAEKEPAEQSSRCSGCYFCYPHLFAASVMVTGG